MNSEMEKPETLKTKKYKCLEEGLGYIYPQGEDDRNRELLDPNYTPEVNINYPKTQMLHEVTHGQMNYGSVKEKNFGDHVKDNENYSESRNFITGQHGNSHNTQDVTFNGNRKDNNIFIDIDNTRDCAEIHYQFENKLNTDKRYNHTSLADFSETRELIATNTTQLNSKWIIAVKVAVIFLIFVCIVFIFTKFKKFLLFLQLVIAWVGRQGSWSILLFILLFTFTAPLFMSVEIMCIGSGLIFSGVYGKTLGLFVAVFCVAVGYVLGMSICFFTSRYLIHDYIYKKLVAYPIYTAFNQAIDVNGLSFVLLIRLSPILPASMVSYILGVTSLKYQHFALGSVSALPSIFLFTYIGALLQDFSNLSDIENQWGNIVILVIGFIIGIAAIVYITIVTKRRLDALNIMNSSLASTVEVE